MIGNRAIRIYELFMIFNRSNKVDQKAILYLIDSGIEVAGNSVSQISFECNEKNKTIEFLSYADSFSNNHGNNILKIIMKNISTEIETVSIKILDKDLKAYYSQLICALQWILKRKRKGIINLSLGVMNKNYYHELSELIKKLSKKNIYTICAASKEYSLPSVLKEVITVADLKLYEKHRHEIEHANTIDFIVDVYRYGYDNISSSSSYAAPFVTAAALDILNREKIKDIDDLRANLKLHFREWSDNAC